MIQASYCRHLAAGIDDAEAQCSKHTPCHLETGLSFDKMQLHASQTQVSMQIPSCKRRCTWACSLSAAQSRKLCHRVVAGIKQNISAVGRTESVMSLASRSLASLQGRCNTCDREFLHSGKELAWRCVDNHTKSKNCPPQVRFLACCPLLSACSGA